MQIEIKLNLTKEDFEALQSKAAENGIRVSELFESFANDLVDGKYTNGADERMYANDWLSRCDFDNFEKNSFLQYLQEEDELSRFLYECTDYYENDDDFFSKEDMEEMEEEMRMLFEGYFNSRFCKEANPDFWKSARQVYEWSKDVHEDDYATEISANADMEM